MIPSPTADVPSQELNDHADNIHRAILDVIAEGKYRTGDLGGRSKCSEFTKAIIGKLR
jgi:isocitrate dehydrogenase (NAD+)